MKKTVFLGKLVLFYIFLIWITGCSSVAPSNSQPSVTQNLENAIRIDEFTLKNDFGDGYVAHILVEDVKQVDQDEIVKTLVRQWLEHYKTQSIQSDVMIKEYELNEIKLVKGLYNNNPAIVASVKFSVIPKQIPNGWASFPGSEITPNDTWWHLEVLFGIYGNDKESKYYWLKILPIG